MIEQNHPGLKEQKEFLQEWPITRLEKMTLDEYTNLDTETAFIYWLEMKTSHSGGISGGSAFKFGIFRRRNLQTKKENNFLLTDGKYAWFAKYGKTSDEAFQKIKKMIVTIAKASQAGRFEEIDAIDFGTAIKWKIAFHYNPEKLIPIFKRDVLERYAESRGADASSMTISELQQYSIRFKPDNVSTLEFSHDIWHTFRTDNFYYHVDKFINQAQTDDLKKSAFPKSFKGLEVKVSFGVGTLAHIPWLALVKPPNTISQGIFPVYLYFKSSNVLILAYGVSESSQAEHRWPNESALQTIKDWFNENDMEPPSRYGDSYVKAAYDLNVNEELEPQQIQTDLDEILEVYDRIAFHRSSSSVEEPSEPFTPKKYWIIAPGEGARKWQQFYDDGVIGIGWDDMGDLRKYDTREDIRDGLIKRYPQGSKSQKNNSLALWEFARVVSLGDIIIPKRGTSEYLGYGVVISDYYFDENQEEYKHQRKVQWKKNGVWPEDVHPIVTKTLTDITKYPEYVDRVKRLIGIEQDQAIPKTVNYWWLKVYPKSYPITDFEIGEEHVFSAYTRKGTKRHKYEHYQEVKPGDLILGFAASPIKKVLAVFEALKGLYLNEDSGEEEIAFTVQKLLPSPISLQNVLELPGISETDINKGPGSLIKLSKEQFSNILDYDLAEERDTPDYTKEDALKELYIHENELDKILAALEYKKNIVLQGPPGVGKTFMAKILAYTLMGEIDKSKIEFVQFHQSYSYEDFIQGFRPQQDTSFKLEHGVFYRFCKKAQVDQENKYFFIIDEINRGNLSKIFGELMLLIEHDKRGPEYAVSLTYSHGFGNRFYIPSNVYIIGTMNTADRSLAIVDYALRRRFSFIDVTPNFNEKFRDDLINQGVDEAIVQKIMSQIPRLNANIEKRLGKGFRIGHSYFCNIPTGTGESEWYANIIENEIAPLLREYWFDNEELADAEIKSIQL